MAWVKEGKVRQNWLPTPEFDNSAANDKVAKERATALLASRTDLGEQARGVTPEGIEAQSKNGRGR